MRGSGHRTPCGRVCRPLFITALIAFAAMASCAAQQWTPVVAYQHFRYSVDGANETDVGHLPATYRFLNGPAPRRTVCALADRPGVFWYTPDGTHLDGTFVSPSPSEFDVSIVQKRVRGFSATASFAGSAANAGAVEVVYFTDRVCSDGGVEYGFSRDLATGSILVYWSTYANCSNDAGSLCRKTNDPALGDHFSNVQQENGGTASEHGFRIYGLDVNAKYTYRMFVEEHAFRVQVAQDGKLANCSDSESGPPHSCSFLKRTQSWFPIDQLAGGVIVAGTQTGGTPNVEPESKFQVSDILVAK